MNSVKSINTQLKNGLKSVLSTEKKNIIFLSHRLETRLAYGRLPQLLMEKYNVIMVGAECVQDSFERMGHAFIHIPCKVEFQGEWHYVSVNVDGIDLIITADSVPDQAGKVDKEFLNKDAKRMYIPSDFAPAEITEGAFDVIALPSKSVKAHYAHATSQLFEAGMPLLDEMLDESKRLGSAENILTYAPAQRPAPHTPLGMNLMAGYENMLIEWLLTHTDMKVNYRLHPVNFRHQIPYYHQLKQQWKSEDRVIFDEDMSGCQSLSKSKIFLSDFSSMAYVFSLATARKSIFFVNHMQGHDDFIQQAKKHKIAWMTHTTKQLQDALQAPCKEDELKRMRDEDIYHVGASQERILECVHQLLK